MPISIPRQSNVFPGRALRFLLEAVKHMDRIGESSDVDHTERAIRIADPDFPYTLTNSFHWPPVVRVEAKLHLVELKTGILPHRLRKSTQVLQRSTVKPNRLSRLCH